MLKTPIVFLVLIMNKIKILFFLTTLLHPVISFCQIENKILLQEVIISKNKINAVDLGIINIVEKPKFTRAERRLQEAKSGFLQPIINYINGKTDVLKKEIIVEKKEFAFQKLKYLFENDYYIKTLKIPLDYIISFQYYLIENQGFCLALKTDKKYNIMWIMCELSIEYKNLNNI